MKQKTKRRTKVASVVLEPETYEYFDAQAALERRKLGQLLRNKLEDVAEAEKQSSAQLSEVRETEPVSST